MRNILKFNDFISKIDEGIGDKYLKNKYGIPDEFDEFEKQYKKIHLKKEEEIIGEVKGTSIVKNPKSLNKLDNGVRGVITKEGDLYLAILNNDVIHNDILEFLNKKGIINERPVGWEWIDERKPDQFITIQRVWNKNIIAIGESYVTPKRDPEKTEALKIFKPYLEKCKQKNKNIEFVPILIKSAIRTYLNENELLIYKKKGS